MKKIYNIVSILIIGLFIFACSDEFLELAPLDSASVANFYKTDSDFETAIMGVYGNWRRKTVRAAMMTEYRADNFKCTTNTDFGYQLAENDFEPDFGIAYWNHFSWLVFPSNMILSKLDQAEGINADVANRIRGEALFFRGYAYYWMNIMFGGVPLITTPVGTDEALSTPRAAEVDIWEQAANDFKTAASLLPDAPEVRGRVDKYAAMGFEAKVYMQQKQWDKAVTVLKDIYENSGHRLEANWIDMWNEEGEKNSNEIMLQSVFSELYPNNDFAVQFLNIEDDPTTHGNFTYKSGLFESFESSDIRRDGTLGIVDYRGGGLNNKFDYGKVGNNWTMDMIILRFADIVTMYSEALSMSAGSVQQQSLDLINMTRSRAGLEDLIMADVPDLDSFVEAILAERRAEFVFEGNRYADLKRHDKLLEKLAEAGYDKFDNNYLLIPLPQREIDKMPDVLVQNTGY